MLMAFTRMVIPTKIEVITVVPVLKIPRRPVIALLTLLKSMMKATASKISPKARIAQAAILIAGKDTITMRPMSSVSNPNKLTKVDNLLKIDFDCI